MTRNPEIKNTPVWFLPNIWRLGWVSVFLAQRYFWMLQNTSITAFTVSELLRENQQGVKLPPPPPSPSRLGLISAHIRTTFSAKVIVHKLWLSNIVNKKLKQGLEKESLITDEKDLPSICCLFKSRVAT